MPLSVLPYSEGHHKTVYSVVWPETKRTLLRCTQEEAALMLARHDHPHLKQQDAYGPDFAQQWWEWSQAATGTMGQWPEFYPTAGASEALREVINELGGGRGTLVVFEGEYEGYAAIANGQGIPVVRIDRDHWQEQWANIAPTLGKVQWWISEPSSIDGCWWNGFAQWAKEVHTRPNTELWWDASYVGATTRHTTHDCGPFTGMVFSLSKPAGMYYRRVGGCFARRPVSGLWGNRWFKNIDSLYVGQAWMRDHARGVIPAQYAPLQQIVLDAWNAPTPPSQHWQASDVILLAHSRVRPHTETDERHCRHSHYRVCLTPALSALVDQLP